MRFDFVFTACPLCGRTTGIDTDRVTDIEGRAFAVCEDCYGGDEE